jgi:hypothetical protein
MYSLCMNLNICLLNVFFLCMASYGIPCFKWIEIFVSLFLHSLMCNMLWLYYIMSELKHCSSINAFFCVWLGVMYPIVNGLKYLFLYFCIFLCGKIVIYHVVKFICTIFFTHFKSDYVDFLFHLYFLFRF